jgi:tRNA-specific 2-thiouridylase
MMLAVALSGGVDSSVAALLLRESRPRMAGASHLIWPDSRCCSVEVLARAQAVCLRLGIPYYRIDLQQEFAERVVEDFVAAYLAGRTPNPCIRCNRFVRFDRFHTRLRERLAADGLLAESEELALATGHYARVRPTEEGWVLEKGRDQAKDQSYMLHQVRREMLPYLVLPLGEMLKSEVTRKAAELGLDYAAVRESQDACFVDGDYAEFIRSRTGREELLVPGEIVDLTGRALGRHRGILRYTVGQRQGLGLGSGPWYVARIEPAANRLVVARHKEVERRDLEVGEVNWLIEPPEAAFPCGVKVRYRSPEVPGRVEPEAEPSRPDGWRARVTLERPEIITPGQSAVFYRRDRVLGGGVIR